MLVGGQLTYLLAIEHGAELQRPTDDVNVVMDVRQNKERDWADAALLLSLIESPLEMAEACTDRDPRRLAQLRPLLAASHPAWLALSNGAGLNGREALAFLLRP
jgi:hypothetical protein